MDGLDTMVFLDEISGRSGKFYPTSSNLFQKSG